MSIFLPFFASVDGLLGVEAGDNLKRISRFAATKCQKTYYLMCRYIKISISVTIVQATH